MIRAPCTVLSRDLQQHLREKSGSSLQWPVRWLEPFSRMCCNWSHVKPAEVLGLCMLDPGRRFAAQCRAAATGRRGVPIRAPPDAQEWSRIDDLLEWDVVAVAGASGGNIEGGGVGGLGFGTLLQVSLPPADAAQSVSSPNFGWRGIEMPQIIQCLKAPFVLYARVSLFCDEPHACIFLQMLAPSHRAQVLF